MHEKAVTLESGNIENIVHEFRRFNGIIPETLVKKLAKGMAFSSDRSKPIFARNLNILYAKAMQQMSRTETPFLPLPKNNSGDLVLGELIQGDREYGDCYLPISKMTHTFIGGASGTGKSNLQWTIIKQLVDNNCKILAFDRKLDMRNIASTVPLVILNANDLRINIFEPPSEKINIRTWISKVCDLFTIWGIYYSSRNYIKEHIISVLESGRTPTIYDVYYSMKSKIEKGSTRTNYHDTSLNKIENIVEELSTFFSCRKSFPMRELLSTPLVIEVDTLSMQSERFLIAYFLLSIIEMRRAESVRGNPELDEESLFVFVDEAASLWNPQLDFSERSQELSFDMLQEIPLIARDFKICLFFSSQRPLSKNVMANARTKILSSMPDAEDAWYMANSVGVKPEVFQTLDTGQFLVKSGKSEPFLIRTEKIERQVVGKEDFEIIKKPFADHILNNCTPLIESVHQEKVEETSRLDSSSKKFLINIAKYPSLTVTQRYDVLSLKGRYAQDLKQSLIDHKMIEEIFLAIGSSKQSTFLVPTQKAIEYLESLGESVTFYKHIGKTSALHNLLQAMVIEYFTSKGCTVKNDFQIGEKFVDIFVESQNKKVVIEVAVSPSIDADRVVTALDLVDEFVILVIDVMTLKSIESQLKTIQSEKIKLILATNFLAGLKKGTLDIILLNILEQQNSQNSQNPASSQGEQTENRS